MQSLNCRQTALCRSCNVDHRVGASGRRVDAHSWHYACLGFKNMIVCLQEMEWGKYCRAHCRVDADSWHYACLPQAAPNQPPQAPAAKTASWVSDDCTPLKIGKLLSRLCSTLCFYSFYSSILACWYKLSRLCSTGL